jgi:hypothetical protein
MSANRRWMSGFLRKLAGRSVVSQRPRMPHFGGIFVTNLSMVMLSAA